MEDNIYWNKIRKQSNLSKMKTLNNLIKINILIKYLALNNKCKIYLVIKKKHHPLLRKWISS